MDDEYEVPSDAAHLAAVIEGTTSGSYSAVTKSLTARVTIMDIALLDAMAAASKKTRTYILNRLIAIGADLVLAEMTKTAVKKIRQDQGKRLTVLLEDVDLTEETE